MNRTSVSIGAKSWMVLSFIIETAMTVTMWSLIPLFFKLWSVFCLMVDAFLITREFILHPVHAY